jgi:hypothetical protein
MHGPSGYSSGKHVAAQAAWHSHEVISMLGTEQSHWATAELGWISRSAKRKAKAVKANGRIMVKRRPQFMIKNGSNNTENKLSGRVTACNS